jgi:YegS/Rv2252/BmrU family lipid kinase
MKKMIFVFNPHSGKALIKNSLMKIVQVFSEADIDVTVYPTKAPLDGYEYIKSKEGQFDILACSGGDGTLNEAVRAVLEYSGTKPPIGYIPSGSTNDFAASLNIPKDMVRAAAHIAEGEPVKCDVGMINNKRSFNYVAAFGAFTEVSYATPQHLKNLLGHQAYVLEGVKSIADLKPYRVKVTCDELQTEESFAYGMVSNADSVGGMKGLAGVGVDLQDGLFEVILVKELKTPLDIQQLVTAFLSRNYEKCDVMYSFKTRKICFESDEPLKWTLDGEFGGEHNKTELEVMPQAVEFIVKKRKKNQEKP